MLYSCLKKPAAQLCSGLFLCALFFFSNHSYASSGTPFLTRNQSPLSLIYGIPVATPARLLEQNSSRWISSLNIANTLISQTGSNDSLYIDVETYQLNLFYDLSLTKNWMLRTQFPLIAHSSGMLDSAIDSYHHALSLPESLQHDLPFDQIEMNYSQDGVTNFNITSSQQALGDISLQLAWQAQKTNKMAMSYWGSLKLPSGDEKKLTGSGGSDIATWVAMDYQLSNTRWFYGQAGLLYMHNNKVLDSIHNNWATFAAAGIVFQQWSPLEIKVQLEYHSALYDTEIKFMRHVYLLTFGGSYLINKKHSIDFAVAEDLKTGASPDVNFNISWTVSF